MFKHITQQAGVLKKCAPVPSGIAEIDEITGGLCPGEVWNVLHVGADGYGFCKDIALKAACAGWTAACCLSDKEQSYFIDSLNSGFYDVSCARCLPLYTAPAPQNMDVFFLNNATKIQGLCVLALPVRSTMLNLHRISNFAFANKITILLGTDSRCVWEHNSRIAQQNVVLKPGLRLEEVDCLFVKNGEIWRHTKLRYKAQAAHYCSPHDRNARYI